jgi:hypothetical protein
MMEALKFLVAALFIGFAFLPGRVVSQTPARPPNLIETLNKEANASDPAGIHAYSGHLIQLLVPDRAGKAYIDSLSDRLARAELMSRNGKQKLVPETEVAQAFNDLMRQIAAPPSLKTSGSEVRLIRNAFEKIAPTLISREKNEVYCNPSEAVFLVWVLIPNNGKSSAEAVGTYPLTRVEVHVSNGPNAASSLSAYLTTHPQSDDVKLFNHLAKVLEF